jgi:parallel beta-helix repeat protein
MQQSGHQTTSGPPITGIMGGQGSLVTRPHMDNAIAWNGISDSTSAEVDMRRSRLFLGSILTVSLLLLGLPAAAADTIGCGETITTDVALTEDLVCSGDGLIVGAEGITIDLAGHSITGSSVGVGISVYYQATIRNGTIENFPTGIDPDYSGADIGLEKLHIANNDTAIRVLPFSEILLTKSSLIGNGVGIEMAIAGTAIVKSSDVNDNFVGIGRISSASTLEIHNSTVSGNSKGLSQSQADGAIIVGSEFSNNGTAIELQSSRANHIERNRVFDNDIGIKIGDPESERNIISQNRFFDNRVGIQIGSHDGVWGGEGTEITKNTFTDNGEAGLLINLEVGFAQGVVVSGNTFRRNGFDSTSAINDGLHISGVETLLAQITVSRNRAFWNADYGIQAVGVTDGGMNKAKNNGNPDQCLGVNC